jgi:hypothetical protein
MRKGVKREKKWFKDHNDGNYEPILECKRKRKYLFPPTQLHKLVFG